LFDTIINQFLTGGIFMKVVVIGAGFAGLSAARHLSKRGIEVDVVEARDRVGGRTLNHVFEDGSIVEVGGQWVGPTQNHVLELIDELGLDTFDTFDTGDYVVSLKGKIKKFKGDTFGLPPHVLVEVGLTQKRLESMAAKVPLDAPWTSAHAIDWDSQTLETWLRRHLRFEQSRQFWRAITAAIFSAEATEMSLLHFLFYCHSGGMLDRLMGTANGAQKSRIVGGSQLIAQRMAEELGNRVHLEEPVTGVSQSSSGVIVRTPRSEYHADAAIVAIPQHLIGNIVFNPPLPPRRQQLVQNVPMGAVIKIVAKYTTPFWREDKMSGFGVSLDHPVSITFDNSPPDASSGMLVGFFEGAHGRSASALSVDERRDVFVRTLVDLFGSQAASPLEVVELDWTAEQWSGGCYGGHLGPGVWTQLGDELVKPFGRIEWAGTETAAEWNGYMDGAISSGYLAADRVLTKASTTASIA
jgi:monoamine oxidase